ncbi:HD domain-containing protein [Actinomadura chibensis]|uniref:HD domain-containing protein n=1 Tax=Actinomadura chibensis TaxID=392828 RepID=A0A5D0NGX2_9ACTN|nr:HD domain-containing protein [Actinomadura chibensis]
MPDANALQRSIAEAARTIAYTSTHLWRRVDRYTRKRRKPTPHPTTGNGRHLAVLNRDPTEDGEHPTNANHTPPEAENRFASDNPSSTSDDHRPPDIDRHPPNAEPSPIDDDRRPAGLDRDSAGNEGQRAEGDRSPAGIKDPLAGDDRHDDDRRPAGPDRDSVPDEGRSADDERSPAGSEGRFAGHERRPIDDDRRADIERAAAGGEGRLVGRTRRAVLGGRRLGDGGGRFGGVERRPVGDGAVEHDGEVVLARGADLSDPALVLRVAAAAAQEGLPLAPATVARLAEGAALPGSPWPIGARDALVSLLGAGPAAIGVWEALDQAGLVVRLLPEWERVRNRPQRNPVHRFTVDRHLVETAAGAAALTREVSRPDLLLVGALLHDIGKGRPGDHSVSGAAVARDIAAHLGFPDDDVRVLETVVRHHLLLPETATRRDLDDPMTVRSVTDALSAVPGRERETLDLLAALAVADGTATGPAAWGAWKAGLVAELARRAAAALSGGTPPAPVLDPAHLALARHDGAAVRVIGPRVTIAAPDRPGLLWRAAGVLALHRLAVKTARTVSSTPGGHRAGGTAVLDFTAVPEFGTPPDPADLEADLRRMLADRLDVAERLERRARSARTPRPGMTVPPPRVVIVDDASRTATVVEVRAHDRPGLLWRIGRTLGACGLQVRAAQVDTLGAEAVDVFYVVDETGLPLNDPAALAHLRSRVLATLH